MSWMKHSPVRIAADANRLIVQRSSRRRLGGCTAPSRLWTCAGCSGRARTRKIAVNVHPDTSAWSRNFSRASLLLRDSTNDESRTSNADAAIYSHSNPNAATPISTSLPSQIENRRSLASKRIAKIVDVLLARASTASQHINAYTGTDYSGIEALRKEITEQEKNAKSYHVAVNDAKTRHHEALAQQTSAQREIVGLLERKASWSPADLERYMSLVRSEHINDQAVSAAKDNLAEAERTLEDARSLLESLERKQYHEEQIWSDTIRRNSTWVTFGLMGVNILLLLAQITIFEPYRRKKIVADVKIALAEKTVSPAPARTEIEDRIDAADFSEPALEPIDAAKLSPTEIKAGIELGESRPGDILVSPDSSEAPLLVPAHQSTTVGAINSALLDLFSERMVQVRKVDVTTTALQGAATGVAVMSILLVLLRRN